MFLLPVLLGSPVVLLCVVLVMRSGWCASPSAMIRTMSFVGRGRVELTAAATTAAVADSSAVDERSSLLRVKVPPTVRMPLAENRSLNADTL